MAAESRKRLEGLRPWGDFFSRHRWSKPVDGNEFKRRFTFNVSYFQNNYLLVSFVVTAYFLVTNIFLLLAVVVGFGGFKYIKSLPVNSSVAIMGNNVSPNQLWIVYGVVIFILLFFTSASSILLWIVGTIAALVAIHAGFMEKPIDAEFGEMEEEV